jgi:excisionase family DNA binding protein
MADSEYLTPPAAARQLGVSAEKIRLWILAGEIPAVDLATTADGPPRYRILKSALAAFLKRRSALAVRGRRPFAASRKTGESSPQK